MEMDDRLSRIEAKLDKLSDAVVAIARTEEQIATIFSTQRAIEARLEGGAQELARLRERTHDLANKNIVLAARLDAVEECRDDLYDMKIQVHDNTKVTDKLSKVMWTVTSTVVVMVLYAAERMIFGG